ncbi:MAG: antitoxin [Planctomycetota bacterium]
MSRISIDVTADEHQRLKAMAALQGKSIKDFVLESTLGRVKEGDALLELEAILRARLGEAETGSKSSRTVGDIFQQARAQAEQRPDA